MREINTSSVGLSWCTIHWAHGNMCGLLLVSVHALAGIAARVETLYLPLCSLSHSHMFPLLCAGRMFCKLTLPFFFSRLVAAGCRSEASEGETAKTNTSYSENSGVLHWNWVHMCAQTEHRLSDYMKIWVTRVPDSPIIFTAAAYFINHIINNAPYLKIFKYFT